MKLVYIFRKKDPRFFSIERVFRTVIKELPNQNVEELVMPKFGISIRNLLNLLQWRLRNRGYVYHITGDNTYLALALPRRRTIVTLHDMVFLHRESGWRRAILKILLLDLPVFWCRYITVISEATRKELLENVKCDPRKVYTIPNPVVSKIAFIEKEFDRGKPSILFIGVTENKNMKRAVDALRNMDCKLDILGEPDEGQIEHLNASGVRYTCHNGLNEDEVVRLYQSADLILYPSLYEGFGLPILEGFQAGRVVVTSDLDPMRSISSGGAKLVDPYNVDDIRAAVVEVCSNQNLRTRLIGRGFEVLRSYDPSRIAAKYADIYHLIEKG